MKLKPQEVEGPSVPMACHMDVPVGFVGRFAGPSRAPGLARFFWGGLRCVA